MSSIMDLIEPELCEKFALEFAKDAESNFVYTLATANVDQLVPNMVLTLSQTTNFKLSQIERVCRRQF